MSQSGRSNLPCLPCVLRVQVERSAATAGQLLQAKQTLHHDQHLAELATGLAPACRKDHMGEPIRNAFAIAKVDVKLPVSVAKRRYPTKVISSLCMQSSLS